MKPAGKTKTVLELIFNNPARILCKQTKCIENLYLQAIYSQLLNITFYCDVTNITLFLKLAGCVFCFCFLFFALSIIFFYTFLHYKNNNSALTLKKKQPDIQIWLIPVLICG